ncbi:MAG: hypothetical protein K9M75_09075 [Phycisphaerae bacterium]|nr:hypothetical protein [Phycisphaerae bacterium]
MLVKKKLVLFAVSCVLLNVLLTVFGRGSFLHGIIVIGVCLYIGLPLLIVSGVSNYIGKVKFSGKALAVSQYSFYFAVLLWSSVISVYLGGIWLEHDISTAKVYCESLVPDLDDYKVVNGHYPESLTAVSDQTVVPRLLMEDSYYRSFGDSFEFSFDDPGGMMNGFAFSSKDRQWYEWH